MKLKSTENQSVFYETRLEIDIRVNRDKNIIRRSVYNTFALLGDVGGFYGLCVTIAATLLSMINFQKPENLLAKNLFSIHEENKVSDLQPGKQYAFKEYLQSCLPKFCLKSKCLRPNKHDKLFEKARNHLNQELDLVGLIHQLRFFHSAINEIIPSEKVKALKDKTKKFYANSDNYQGGHVKNSPKKLSPTN